mmetsp:Transcript_6694/g.10237  ORF Transcript_6694/g.10237 Transcript_6694/m.10237 type:complete len:130 (+) Transcript_6694:1806-2195(+)
MKRIKIFSATFEIFFLKLSKKFQTGLASSYHKQDLEEDVVVVEDSEEEITVNKVAKLSAKIDGVMVTVIAVEAGEGPEEEEEEVTEAKEEAKEAGQKAETTPGDKSSHCRVICAALTALVVRGVHRFRS